MSDFRASASLCASHPTWVRGLKLIDGCTRRVIVTVAPHVGAWIEMFSSIGSNTIRKVAPHVGAWIEMIIICALCARSRSHPTWVRGLKYPHPEDFRTYFRSHPTWVRGLKSANPQEGAKYPVAPHVGAWIEISSIERLPCFLRVAPHVGAWIEIIPLRNLTL